MLTLCITEAVAELPEHEAIKLKEKLEVLNTMDAEVCTFLSVLFCFVLKHISSVFNIKSCGLEGGFLNIFLRREFCI